MFANISDILEFIFFIVVIFFAYFLSWKKAWDEQKKMKESREKRREAKKEKKLESQQSDVKEWVETFFGETVLQEEFSEEEEEELEEIEKDIREEVREESEKEVKAKKTEEKKVIKAPALSLQKKYMENDKDPMGGLLEGENFHDPFTGGIVEEQPLHEDAYKEKEEGKRNRSKSILRKLSSKKDYIVIHDIIGPPKGISQEIQRKI